MSERTCHWQSHGPTINEMTKRGELIREVVALTLGPDFATEISWPFDRATVIIRGMDFVGEYPLITPAEKNDGHWVHAEPHSSDCSER